MQLSVKRSAFLQFEALRPIQRTRQSSTVARQGPAAFVLKPPRAVLASRSLFGSFLTLDSRNNRHRRRGTSPSRSPAKAWWRQMRVSVDRERQ